MASEVSSAPLQSKLTDTSSPTASAPPSRTFESSDVASPATPATTQPARHEDLPTIASAGLTTSPRISSKTLATASPRYSPQPMTAAAAHVDERRAQEERESRKQSVNPAVTALGALLGQEGMSRAHDHPTATSTLSAGLSIAAGAMSVTEPMQVDQNAQTSPVSISSLGSFNSAVPTTAVDGNSAPSSRTTNPSLEAEREAHPASSSHNVPPEKSEDNPEDRPSNRAFTFPGAPKEAAPTGDESRTPLRGMSLPMPRSAQSAGRSPTSSRKHKCPYCSTDFTRHHNLKSHLLTHSHEKPFVCSTCQLRFRRLHDLKRHNKLHTGERPHVCPRCDRSFARGDALARHNKGHGGCAGRRASMTSFNGEGDYDEGSHDGQGESMDGLMYTGSAVNEADRMDEDGDLAEERRRLSLPSLKAQELGANDPSRGEGPSSSRSGAYAAQPSQQQQQQQQSQHPASYPPTARPAGGPPSSSPFHPPANRGSAAASPNPQMRAFSPKNFGPGGTAVPPHGGGPSIYAQSAMTESPKPLSPGMAATHQLGHSDPGSLRRNRSPSLTEQMQRQQYGRRGSARSPPAMGLPPLSNNAHAAPQLPSLPGLAPPDPRYTLQSQTPGAHQPTAPGGGGPSGAGTPYQQPGGPSVGMGSASKTPSSGGPSQGDSGSSHTQGASGEGSANLFASGTDGLWAYMRNLEERVNRLTDEVTTLRKECKHTRTHEAGQA